MTNLLCSFLRKLNLMLIAEVIGSRKIPLFLVDHTALNQTTNTPASSTKRRLKAGLHWCWEQVLYYCSVLSRRGKKGKI